MKLCAKAHIGQCIDATPSTLRAMARIESPGFGVDMDPSQINSVARVEVFMIGTVVGAEIYGKGPAGGSLADCSRRALRVFFPVTRPAIVAEKPAGGRG